MVIATLGKFWQYTKGKDTYSLWFSNFSLGHIPNRNERLGPPKTNESFGGHKYKNVDSGFICNSPRLEITQLSTKSRFGGGEWKLWYIHSYNGIPHNQEKEQSYNYIQWRGCHNVERKKNMQCMISFTWSSNTGQTNFWWKKSE